MPDSTVGLGCLVGCLVKVRRQCSEIVRPYNLNFAMLWGGYGTVRALGEGRAQSCLADCKGRVGGLVIFLLLQSK
jgi:hypothetical protein